MRAALSSGLLLLLLAASASPVLGQKASFRVADVVLEYDVQGSGEPLVLIPGWTQSMATWDLQAAEFAKHFQVIRFSRGPFGLTTDPVDLIALLDHLQLERVHVLGHSVGAAAALRFAIHAPSRVETLVVYGPPSAPGLNLPWSGADSWPALFRRLGITEDPFAAVESIGVDSLLALARLHPLFAIPSERADAAAKLALIWREYTGSDLTTTQNPENATPSPTPKDVAQLRIPTLIVTGAEEVPYFRLAADALHYTIPSAQRATINGGGHMVHLIEPSAFNEAVLEFLQRFNR